jgi:hypothetical protein
MTFEGGGRGDGLMGLTVLEFLDDGNGLKILKGAVWKLI